MMKWKSRRAAFLPHVMALMLPFVMTGCANLTGLVDAKADFGCPVGSGVNCTSLSQTYRGLHRKDDEDAKPRVAPGFSSLGVGSELVRPEIEKTLGDKNESARLRGTLSAREGEDVVELWVLPWVDTDGDLHSESRLWVRIRDARWKLERVRTRAIGSADRFGEEP